MSPNETPSEASFRQLAVQGCQKSKVRDCGFVHLMAVLRLLVAGTALCWVRPTLGWGGWKFTPRK
ncbi:hypothetical protein SAMN06265222_1282 [Neorhodopirellula lusitana]|uniref:Uncharacterized protein n=1 Tax=Neorhodopirellula lusitana TaxID=445327 RepID=A0ABY1QRF9_9BACT|nr:hypothetical protein SAMN06265222_1282 [Neorhodopirellula lusitana]